MKWPVPHPFSHGIWSRLLLAFTTIAGITLIVAAMAMLIFEHSDSLFQAIKEQHVPKVLQVAEFAEIGGEIIAIAPSLLTASDEEQLKAISAHIDRLLHRIDQQLALLHTGSGEFELEVEELTSRLKENLVILRQSVALQLSLQEQLDKRTERLRWLYADLIGELDPLNQDYSYNFDTELERIIDATKRKSAVISSRRLQSSRKYKEAIEQIRSNGVLLVGLMAQASTSGSSAQIDSLAALSGDAAALLRGDIGQLSDDSSTLTLKQVLNDLFVLAEGDRSVFAVKTRILETEMQSQKALNSNRLYVGRLRDLIDQMVKRTHEDTFTAVADSSETMRRARWLLVAMVVLSLGVAGSVLWFYVRGSIVARLALLSKSMLAIADGNLDSEVVVSGNDEIGRMSGALKVFRDTALAVEEAHAQALIDNTDVGLVIAREDGAIHFFNPMAANLFATDAQTMIGRPLNTIVAEGEKGTFADRCTALLRAGTDVREKFTCQGQRSDGSLFPVDVSICKVEQRSRKRLIVTVHDVTEREQAAYLLRKRVRQKTESLSRINVKLRDEINQRRKAQNELVQAGKLAALGQLTAGIAHEMNQPLAAMRHYLHNASKLLAKGRLELHEENLVKVGELIERMAKMINHLKTFARWRNNQLAPVDVNATVEGALTLLASGVSDVGAQVKREFSGSKVLVSADAIRLEQVFVNILGNGIDAVRANPPGNRILRVEVEEQEEVVRISVFDNGPGIDKDHFEKIFDPFFTTKEVGQGLGLGLSISYNIVEGFGGSLIAGPAQGGGSVFTVSLEKAQG
jgi:two-component system phosphoglycerate transport system sensor histidine kinase PgtB